MRKISTTITKKYFDMKMQDLQKNGYFYEYKEQKEHWNKRLNKLIIGDGQMGEDTEIVFLVGSSPHTFKVKRIQHTSVIPERYAEAIKTEYAYVIKCVLAGTRYFPSCHCEKECDFEYLGNNEDYGGYPARCKVHGVTYGH